MNRDAFEKLLKMGYSVDEALALFPSDEKKEETPAAQPEPKPEPAPEPEQKPEPKPEPNNDFFTSMNASMNNIMTALNTLTKAVQAGNRTSMGSSVEANEKKAEDFLKEILEGRTK